MIEIKKTGMCEDCELADLYLEDVEIESFYGKIKHFTIHCAHEEVCAYFNSRKGGTKECRECLKNTL